MTNVTNVIVMMSNQEPLTITTHFSPLFESNCTVLSPQVLCPGRAWGGGRGAYGGLRDKKNGEEDLVSLLVSNPGRSTKG